MRQLSPVTNLLLVLLAAAGLVATLGLPWYAPAVGAEASAGSMEAIAEHIRRWFDTAGTQTFTGESTLGWGESALVLVAAAAALLALATLVPPLRGSLISDLLRFAPLAAPFVVLVQMLSQPRPGMELRWGAFVALGVAGLLASAAYQGASARRPKAPPARYTPPPRPNSVAPPG